MKLSILVHAIASLIACHGSQASLANETSIASASPDTIGWFNLQTANFDSSKKFYGSLFGWSFTPSQDPEGHEVHMIWANDRPIADLVIDAERPINGSGISVYFTVEDLGDTYAKALRLGGTNVRGPVCFPDGSGATAVIRDLDGNRIGLFSSKYTCSTSNR